MLVLALDRLSEERAVVAADLVSIRVRVPVSEHVIRDGIVDVVHLVSGHHVVLISRSDHLVHGVLLPQVA